jgi:uncharacterized alpha-E superfamily protein
VRVLARNAESLFWLARYLERAASLARVIEMQSSFGNHAQADGWAWLLTLHNDDERFRETQEASAANIVAFYLTNKDNTGSVRASIHWARENARALRPFIPTEMWTQLNAFYDQVEHIGDEQIQPSRLSRTCAAIRAGCLAQIGTAESTLYRDEGYQFFRLGLLVERADQTSRLLDVKFAQGAGAQRSADPAQEFVFWSTILRTAAAYQVFHRLEPASASADRVARFLVLNARHPRSIAYCVREITDALHVLRGPFHLSAANPCLEACELLTQGLVEAEHDQNLLARLHNFNDWVQRALMRLTTDIGVAFFRQKPPEPRVEEPAQTQTQTQTQGTQTQTQSQS